MFSKHLDIMSQYLPKSQFDNYKFQLDNLLSSYQNVFNQLNVDPSQRKFRIVDGQVILLAKDEFDAAFADVEDRPSPEDWVRRHWNVTADYWLERVQGCMLRGMTLVDKTDMDNAENGHSTVKLTKNVRVDLTRDTVPAHMHQSGISVEDNRIQTLAQGQEGQSAIPIRGGTRYDVFRNDGVSTGVDKNEHDGAIDDFTILEAGSNDGQDPSNPKIAHNNMPVFKEYYAFVVHRMTIG